MRKLNSGRDVKICSRSCNPIIVTQVAAISCPQVFHKIIFLYSFLRNFPQEVRAGQVNSGKYCVSTVNISLVHYGA